MMKKNLKTLGALLFSLFLWVPSTHAKAGIGIMGGDPNGITLKINRFPVIEFGYDLGLYGNSANYDLNVDYWLLNNSLGGPFKWFLGIGASAQYNSNSGFGVGARVPIGIQWWPSSKIEVFAEVAPGLTIFPRTGFDADWGLGIRFYIF